MFRILKKTSICVKCQYDVRFFYEIKCWETIVFNFQINISTGYLNLVFTNCKMLHILLETSRLYLSELTSSLNFMFGAIVENQPISLSPFLFTFLISVSKWAFSQNRLLNLKSSSSVEEVQCDQIGRFIGLWASF